MDHLISPVSDAYGLNNLLGLDFDGRSLAGLNGESSLFSLILVRLLIQTASELQRVASAPIDISQNDALDALALLTEPSPALADDNGTTLRQSFGSTQDMAQGKLYTPGVATRAYRRGDDWQFIPVYIPPTPELETSSGSEPILGTDLSSSIQHPAPVSAADPVASVPPAAASIPPDPSPGALSLSEFPRPAGDNGRGMHWVPTVASTREVVDRFIRELREMNVRWVVFLNDHTNLEQNEYLVDQLVANGIEPVMRVYTPGLEPISGDLGALVRHYVARGVRYFQLYNEPNHAVENGGQTPDVPRYLDLWIPAAKIVAENGGLPGFGALSPGGEAANPYPGMQRLDDRLFLQAALQEIKRRGETAVLDRAWLSAHNYMGERALEDPNGLLRVRQYDEIVRRTLGRSLPIIGTEGGSYVSESVTDEKQAELVTAAMRYMRDEREPFNFAYTYWVIANVLGGSGDPAWEWQALYRDDGTSPVVAALKGLA